MSSDNYYLDEAEDEGPTSATRRGISAIILAGFGGLAALMATLFESIGEFFALVGDLRDFGTALILDGPGFLLERGAAITGSELEALGLFAFTGAVALIAISWTVWGRLDPEVPLIDQLLPWR